MMFVVSVEGLIVAEAHETDADLEAWLDSTMAEIVKLEATDPSIDVNLATRQVWLSVLVERANPLDAIEEGSALLRTAIHAAGGATPDWPDKHDGVWGIELVSVNSTRSTELVDA